MLDRLEWSDLPEGEATGVAAAMLFDGDNGRLENITVNGRGAVLPFCDTATLLWLMLRARKGGEKQDLFVLLARKSGRSFLLDGSSTPVHHVNRLEGVKISGETAADYLRFFCFAVRGDEGPFLLLEEARGTPSKTDPPAVAIVRDLAGPLAAHGSDDAGRYLFRGIVHYAGVLFRSAFAVAENGMVEMLEDEPVLNEVPDAAIPVLPDLLPAEALVARLESTGALAPTGPAILRTMVELLLVQALAAKRESRLLAHFNAQQSRHSPLERFAHFVLTASPVVAIESTLPFIEESVAQIVQDRQPPGKKVRRIEAEPDANDDTRLRIRIPSGGPALVLLPFHAYRSLVDVERVSHEIAAREISCLIGCERVTQLADSLRQVVDLTLTLPRLDTELFEALFRRVMAVAPPAEWTEGDTHWVTHVHHSDFQHPQGLKLTPGEALAYIRERASQRLHTVQPDRGLGLRELHGLGEARIFAEDLITDIHEAVAGRLDWKDVDRGVLLVGAPGTGKTTLARAIAKDSGIRFVGASAASWQAAGHLGDHIRAMRADFALARRFAPAILFIDEIDSIGNREQFTGHNAQYSVQVVNALLEQLQGLDRAAPVIVIAATNHVDRVDQALRRAGRLDRAIEIPLPNTEALSHIYAHYLEQYAAEERSPDLDANALGRLSFGSTGADVELFVRGAARRARRAGRPIRQRDVIDEITRKPRDPASSLRLTPEELRRVAVHEAGHVLATCLSDGRGAALGFVSVVPRADNTLGFVARLASERVLLTRTEYLEQLEILLAGRAAEEIILGEQSISGGAGGDDSSDLARATNSALALVTRYGLGPDGSLLWSGSPSPQQRREAEDILRDCYKAVLMKLSQNRDTLQRIAGALVEHQELTGEEVRNLIG